MPSTPARGVRVPWRRERFGVKPKLGKAKLVERRAKFSRPGSNKSELAKRYSIARSTLTDWRRAPTGVTSKSEQ